MMQEGSSRHQQQGGENRQSDFLDSVFDPCGLVGDIEEAVAHKQRMKAMKALKDETPTMMSDSGGDISNECGESAHVKKNDDDAVDSMMSNFDVNCCGFDNKNQSGTSEQAQLTEEEILTPEENNRSFDDRDRSLADIAAKMNDIDLETAAEDSCADQIGDYDCIDNRSSGKIHARWYHQRLYASLIVLCGLSCIAIIVMAILLIVRK